MAAATQGSVIQPETKQIPAELRCAACDGILVAAMKLPCCNQSVCDSCRCQLATQYCPIRRYIPHAAHRARPETDLRAAVARFSQAQTGRRGQDITAARDSYVVRIEHLRPGTTEEDMMRCAGGNLEYCSLIKLQPTLIFEVAFHTKIGAESIIKMFSGLKVKLHTRSELSQTLTCNSVMDASFRSTPLSAYST